MWSMPRGREGPFARALIAADGPFLDRRLVVVVLLAHLFLHRRATRLEGREEPVPLLLDVLAALVEEIARATLRLLRHLLRLLEPLLAVLAQELARLRAALGSEQERRGRSRHRSEKEPAQIARRVPATFVHHDLCPPRPLSREP